MTSDERSSIIHLAEFMFEAINSESDVTIHLDDTRPIVNALKALLLEYNQMGKEIISLSERIYSNDQRNHT